MDLLPEADHPAVLESAFVSGPNAAIADETRALSKSLELKPEAAPTKGKAGACEPFYKKKRVYPPRTTITSDLTVEVANTFAPNGCRMGWCKLDQIWRTQA